MTDAILNLPVLPLRDIVVFPHMVVTLFVGRAPSIAAINKALENDQKIFLLAQKKASIESPKKDDLYETGVIAAVTQMITLPDGTIKLLVEGLARAKVTALEVSETVMTATVAPDKSVAPEEEMPAALLEALIKVFLEYAEYNKKISSEFIESLSKESSPSKIIDLVASQLTLPLSKQQNLLELDDLNTRVEKILTFSMAELDALKLEEKVRSRVKKQMEKNQREYYLSEQMKAIQSELQQGGTGQSELDQLKARLKKTKLSPEARKKADQEVRKLSQMNPMSSEASIVRNYLEWLLDLPWHTSSRLKKDLPDAKKILDQDHYGLEKVKDRILEHLAVQQRVGKTGGQILCLVGPPGVGKTSLGKSIAKATGRAFVRASLGGLRDEAEIRGHRRTYIGAMPGRIIQGMKKAKKSNPLFLLDEIDKMGADWRGDPASAMLEVLDPAQNKEFSDHYLEVDYDLSNVFFIATANSLDLPRPLLDRMEIIRLAGYTEAEKEEIAKRHLIKKQMQENGLNPKEMHLSDEALMDIIRHYTNEAGVRDLERQIATLCRKAVKEILETDAKSIQITPAKVRQYLGVPRYKHGRAEQTPLVGVTTGLAWTQTGGELLTIEAALSEGKGKLTITGKLGDVMKESIQAGLSYIKSRAAQFGINPSLFHQKDLHIHVPEGATPKDGPSAGTAICTSVVSILTGIPVRSDVAMTGEITLRGRVLPIGGLKEKLLAAHRGFIKTVFIPEENEKDLEDIPDVVKKGIEIVPVEDFADLLPRALTTPPLPFKTETHSATPSSSGGSSDSLPPTFYPTGHRGAQPPN